MDGVVHQFVDALVFAAEMGNHRDAQHGFHLVDATVLPLPRISSIMFSASTMGDVQLHELHGQIQVALDVGGVHDVDDAGGRFSPMMNCRVTISSLEV